MQVVAGTCEAHMNAAPKSLDLAQSGPGATRDCLDDREAGHWDVDGPSRWQTGHVLHLARAAALGALNQESLKLGAIPFHHEQASADTTPLLAASNRCMHLTYYEASLDWASSSVPRRNSFDYEHSFVVDKVLFTVVAEVTVPSHGVVQNGIANVLR